MDFRTDRLGLLLDQHPTSCDIARARFEYQVAFSEGDLRLGYSAAMSLVLGLVISGFTVTVLRLLRSESA